MSTVTDLAGNNPVALDPSVRRHDKVSSVEFRGPTQIITIGASAVLSTAFGNRTRFIRIAPTGDIYYDIGTAPDAANAAKRSYLVQDAVEPVPVRPGEKISVILSNASTGFCDITEDAV